MLGGSQFLLTAEVILIMVWRGVIFVSPVLVLAAVWWVVNRTEVIIHYLFPNLQWEMSLGWLNIQATRRAEAVLRWFGYGLYLILAVALLGIVWGAEALAKLDQGLDPAVVAQLLVRGPVMMVCLGLYMLYFGSWLIPRLRAQAEKRELEQFRLEARDADEQREQRQFSRVKSPFLKPGRNEMSASEWTRRRR